MEHYKLFIDGQWVDGANKKEIGRSAYKPTILTNEKRDMKIVCMEIFAPVVTILPYDDINEAIEYVNDSQFGLQAGIFTSDVNLSIEKETMGE